ncbi:hypothetical protein [Enterobacter sp. Bisph1]|uniref:hypothetical protein n=1 Tax=Enterobacter sp. Bisph1 TaxID=1274399 RepID=UPI00057BE98F|nr:hypothetical protein [Enterobacter sp. Bisph1]
MFLEHCSNRHSKKYPVSVKPRSPKKLVDAASKADAAQQQKAQSTQISKDYLVKQQDALIKLMQSPGCDADYQKLAQYSINQLTPVIDNYDQLQRSNNIPKAAIATISLAMPALGKAVAPSVAEWAGSSTLVNRGIVAGTNGVGNLLAQGDKMYVDPNEKFSLNSFYAAVIAGGTTANMGFYGTTTVNTAAAGISSALDGQSPWVPMATGMAGSMVGYGVGGRVQKHFEYVYNPWSNGFQETYSLKMPPLSTGANKISLLPSAIGAGAGSTSSEFTSWYLSEQGKKILKGDGK